MNFLWLLLNIVRIFASRILRPNEQKSVHLSAMRCFLWRIFKEVQAKEGFVFFERIEYNKSVMSLHANLNKNVRNRRESPVYGILRRVDRKLCSV